jgi:hypothetical protein
MIIARANNARTINQNGDMIIARANPTRTETQNG